MNEEKLLEILYADTVDFKGNELTKERIRNDKEFRDTIIKGVLENKITGFDQDFYEKISKLNVRWNHSFEDVFRLGFNIGACTTASKYVSYIFPSCQIAGGVNKYLVGTKNSDEGQHTWIVSNDGKIYDTTFMLIIDRKYSNRLGYVQENIYDPNIDRIYSAGKEFANDRNLRVR